MNKLLAALITIFLASSQALPISWKVIREAVQDPASCDGPGSKPQGIELVYFQGNYIVARYGSKVRTYCEHGVFLLHTKWTYDFVNKTGVDELIEEACPQGVVPEVSAQAKVEKQRQEFCRTELEASFGGRCCKFLLLVVNGKIGLYKTGVSTFWSKCNFFGGCRWGCPHNPCVNSPHQQRVFDDVHRQLGECMQCSFNAQGDQIVAGFASGAIALISGLHSKS